MLDEAKLLALSTVRGTTLAFGLMVTLILLYREILRPLALLVWARNR